ncbi:MAG: hypothetical protein DLM55_03065 [Acidimicrobiales bacterium]|nr:MAG: hypothetical protein DLM55_03065 [Acidimicrobiales bacterium]
MNQPGQPSDSWLDVVSGPVWVDLAGLRETWSGKMADPETLVDTSFGRKSLRVMPSLPILDLARMAHPELVKQTRAGELPAFGLCLDTCADPSQMDLASQRVKPLLLNLAVDDGYDPPCAYIKVTNSLVLAESLSHMHCHFTGGETTPTEALELLHRASVNESAGMVSVYPRELDSPLFGLMLDLTGLRLQFPKTTISVSGDEKLEPALTVALSVVNRRCQEFDLADIKHTELPVALTTSRQSGAGVPSEKVTKTSAGPDVRGVDPLAPPPRARLGPGDGNANKRRRRR